jgi:putative endonuclease
MFFYVYILESLYDGNRYIGYTPDLKKRIKKHNTSSVQSTKARTPLSLVYFEACLNEKDARRREHYLKTTQGRRFIGLRLQEYARSKRTAPGSGG